MKCRVLGAALVLAGLTVTGVSQSGLSATPRQVLSQRDYLIGLESVEQRGYGSSRQTNSTVAEGSL